MEKFEYTNFDDFVGGAGEVKTFDFAKSEFSKMTKWPMAIAPFGC